MIRMIQSTSAAQAKAYFTDALLKSDYYINDQELQGRFMGKLGERLGINGTATKEVFFALCENTNPVTGKPLTPLYREERTTGYDINFHVPKSVSIVHALSKDDHILKAFQNSMQETMAEIEMDVKTRVRKDDKSEDREADGLAWAEFIHQTARPVDGAAPDPHLHGHCFVFNATYDGEEQKIKAAQFRDIKRDMPYYQARFHKNLSDKLIGLGYGVKRTGKSFELKGVPQAVIDLFSKRTNEIGEIAREKGITDAKALDKLGAITRAKKQKTLGMAELKEQWRAQIGEQVEYATGEENAPVRHAPQKEKQVTITAQDCIDYALHHEFERASVMPDRRVLATAYRHGIGDKTVGLDDITTEFKNDKEIIHVQDRHRNYCTTKPVLAEEQKMVALARKGIGRLRPVYDKAPDTGLDGQQGRAAAHVLTTKNQVSIIIGKAGTGKTTLLKKLVPLLEKGRQKVTLVAPSADASRGTLAKEGFADAQTVARLLLDDKMQAGLKNGTLIVDEAGLLGTRDMSDLLSLAAKQDARLVLVGDTRQHSSVLRGDALRILNTVGGIRAAQVDQVHRQKNAGYRMAVEDLAQGKIKSGFERLDGMGSIKPVDPLKPNDGLVDDYIQAVKKGKSALIVSPTHEQGEAVTEAVRKKLKEAGKLGKKEIKVAKLKNLNLTAAQKRDWRNYRNGQVVQFTQNLAQFKRGSRWTVDNATENGVMISDVAGKKQYLPQDRQDDFAVFMKQEIGLAKGDRVRVTQNGFDSNRKRLDNGTALEVTGANKKGKTIRLRNPDGKTEYEVTGEFGHIDHAYFTTSHAAQGKTVDMVFISQPAATFAATDGKQFYVSVSRGRDAATIYTDDKEALLEHAERLGDRTSAIELVKSKGHSDYVQQKERTDYQNSKQPEPDYQKEHGHDQPSIEIEHGPGL